MNDGHKMVDKQWEMHVQGNCDKIGARRGYHGLAAEHFLLKIQIIKIILLTDVWRAAMIAERDITAALYQGGDAF